MLARDRECASLSCFSLLFGAMQFSELPAQKDATDDDCGSSSGTYTVAAKIWTTHKKHVSEVGFPVQSFHIALSGPHSDCLCEG